MACPYRGAIGRTQDVSALREGARRTAQRTLAVLKSVRSDVLLGELRLIDVQRGEVRDHRRRRSDLRFFHHTMMHRGLGAGAHP